MSREGRLAMTRRRVSHRLPTAALLSEGIAPVDRPWKTLLGKTNAPRLPAADSGYANRISPIKCAWRQVSTTDPRRLRESARTGSPSHRNMLSVADDLERASEWLDAHPELLDKVAADLGAGSGTGRGRCGLSCDTVLRCAVLKHLRQQTYRSLEFALRDSLSAQRFARIDAARLPGKSARQATIGSIRAETWERINRHLLGPARDERVEAGDQVRVDSTATETHILEPSYSRLLYDGVRVLTRLLAAARDKLGADAVAFRDHRRAAGRRALEIGSQRGAAKRAQTYRKLLRLLARTVGYVEAALPAVSAAGRPGRWRGKRPPPNTAICSPAWWIRRGGGCSRARRCRRRRRCRVCSSRTRTSSARAGATPTTGTRSTSPPGAAGWCSTRWWRTAIPPTARAACRCWSGTSNTTARRRRGRRSTAAMRRAGNLDAAKELGVAHVVFHKKRGMKVADMTPSSWLYARLKRFRAGIEAGISYLKRCFGLGLCRRRGLARFKAYVQSAVFAHDLTRRPPPPAPSTGSREPAGALCPFAPKRRTNWRDERRRPPATGRDGPIRAGSRFFSRPAKCVR